jgi:hypothetical protein
MACQNRTMTPVCAAILAFGMPQQLREREHSDK